MRIAFLMILTLVFQTTVSCQKDTMNVPVAAYWQKGDVYNFQISKIKKAWQKNRPVMNDSLGYQARFEVINADSASYTIRWTSDKSFFSNFGIPASITLNRSKYDVNTLIYRTDEFGRFIRIENWKEISDKLTGMMREIISQTEKEKDKQAGLKKSLESLIPLYSSQRGIEQMLFSELQIFHFPYGKQYKRGEVYNYTEELPNLLGEKPVIGNGVILVRHVDFDKQTCQILQKMKILPDTVRHVLSSHFKTIGMKPEAIPSTVESSKYQTADENTFDFIYDPGIPVKISVKRETIIDVLDDKVKKMDQTIIERLP